jgi:hypothetical protein
MKNGPVCSAPGRLFNSSGEAAETGGQRVRDNSSPEKVQAPREPKIAVEITVIHSENLIYSRPDFVLAAYLLEHDRRWECILDHAMPPIAAYSFLLADGELVAVGGICPRCREHPFLRQLLIDFYSKEFPSVEWKLPMVAMPPGIQ